MRPIGRQLALVATLLTFASPVIAQRGGRGNDSTGGRGAGLPLTPTKPLKFTTVAIAYLDSRPSWDDTAILSA